MNKKYERLKNAINAVQNQNSNENIKELIVTSAIVFRPADGLLFSDVEKILNELPPR